MSEHEVGRRKVVSRRAVFGSIVGLGVIGACGGETTPAPAASVKPATVGWMIWGGEEEKKVHNATKDGFEKAYPNLKLDLTVLPLGDPTINYDDKLSAMIAGGNAPDVIRVNVRNFEKAMLPLDDYVKKDKDFDLGDYIPSVLEAGKWKGKLLQIIGKLGPQVLYFNATKFKEQGIPTPREQAEKGTWDFDAFLQAATKLTIRKDAEVKQYGYIPYASFWTWINQGGGKPFNADYSEGYLDKPENHDPVQFRADLVTKHRVTHTNDDPANLKSWQGFVGGFGAMFISGPWQMARIKGKLGDAWDIAPPPLQKTGRPHMQAAGESLWNGTKIPDQAFKYLSYMEGKEGQKIWSKAGTDLPGRKSVMADFAAGKLFDDPTLMPPNGKVWADITPKCEIFPIITKDATDAYTKAYNDVLAGKINAKDAFTEANKVAMISLKSK